MSYEKYRSDLNFIKKFSKAINAATGSEVDANSNVSNKNIATMAPEVHKRDNIGANRLWMHDRITEMFGSELADEYIRQLEDHEVYRHDESGMPIGTPYTMGSSEVITVDTPHGILCTSFEELYDICDSEEILVNPKMGVYQKIPVRWKVLDRNGWTPVIILTKKKRHRDMVVVKTRFGENVIVTDNHPMIVEDDIFKTVPAAESLGHNQYRVKISKFINDKDLHVKDNLSIPTGEKHNLYTIHHNGNYLHSSFPNFKMNEDFGYFIGFFVAEGWFKKDVRTGKFSMIMHTKGDLELERCCDALYRSTGISACIGKYLDGRGMKTMSISHPDLVDFCMKTLRIGRSAPQKKIPLTVFQYPKEFARGVIEGLIDGDGTAYPTRFQIRLASRTCICQVATILNALNVPASMSYRDAPCKEGALVQSHYPLFSVEFPADDQFKNCFKYERTKPLKFSKYEADAWNEITNVIPVENRYYLQDNQFIYDITTETHTFLMQNTLLHNCASITLYPFLFDGMKKLGGSTTAPKRLKSFCGAFINLVFAVAAQLAGAVATPEFLAYLDYFIRKDYGDDYYQHTDKVVDLSSSHLTIDDVIVGCFDQVVYSLNQPAAARGSQSVFWNVAYFDKYYFHQLFDGFVFPDGSSMPWDSVNWLQKRFMKWFNNERLKSILTFPVETLSLLNDGKEYKDKEWADFAAQMYSEGHSFFTYTSDSVDSLASCCFSPETKVVFKLNGEVKAESFFYLFYDAKPDDELLVPYCGTWKKARVIKLNGFKMYRITTKFGDSFECTWNHIWPTQRGDIRTEDLTLEDSLIYYIGGEKVYVPVVDLFDYIPDGDSSVYCFVMEDQSSPYFELPCGVITHNCRLRNGIQDNTFSYTLGAGGVSTGSKCVMTININRLVQNATKNGVPLAKAVDEQVIKVHKYLLAFNSIVKEMQSQHMIPIYDAGFVTPEKQYLTVGVNGFVEGAEFLGIDVSDNAKYQEYVNTILGAIYARNRADKTDEAMFNTEFVPKVSGHVKSRLIDLELFRKERQQGASVIAA